MKPSNRMSVIPLSHKFKYKHFCFSVDMCDKECFEGSREFIYLR